MDEALIQIGANVWLFPADENPDIVQPNVGIVVGSTGTVLINPGNSPRATRRVRPALDQIQAPPVAYVIYTDHYWQHVFGAQTFSAPAVAHTLCRTQLEENAAHSWTPAYVDEEIRRNPTLGPGYEALLRAVDDWQNFQIVLPALTFTDDLTLHIGTSALQLEHIGGPHAAELIIVRIPGSGVTFIGDSLERTPKDPSPDRAIITRLLADESTQLFVDGRTRTPHSRTALAALLDGG